MQIQTFDHRVGHQGELLNHQSFLKGSNQQLCLREATTTVVAVWDPRFFAFEVVGLSIA